MAALTASPHNTLPPSWDETIVPVLRKRLESESRILTKRLSTISITDEALPPDPSQDVRRTVSPPQHRPGDSVDTTGSYPQRPSAIPRPSHSRASERVVASPSPPPPPPPQPAELTRKLGSKRQRAQSTPFPLDPVPSGSASTNSYPTNGMPTPSSSSMSPRVQSPSLGRTTPSRIPTVSSRVRSGSQSSQGFGSLNGGKASFPPSHKFSTSEATSVDSETQPGSLRMKGSSSSLARQRIIDERAPFTNYPPPRALESEFTDRPSAEEERPFQHWYRGDVSRNGGVGEYRVGKRMEMLDIANYGHNLHRPTGIIRPFEEPIPRSENIAMIPRKRAESVSSRERASIYIDPQDETVTGRVLDEMPLTDIEADETDYERDQYHYTYDPPTEFGIQHESSQVLHTNHNRPHADHSSTLPPRIPSSKPQTRIPQPQSRSTSQKSSTPVTAASMSEPPAPAKAIQEARGRAQAPDNTRTKPPTKTKGQKRSKSAADALRTRSEARDSSDLADAVPVISSPSPRNGPWDEVVLPTVARRMGIEYEKENPEQAAKRKARESRVAPAPGTFGYDHTKYKPPRTDEDIPMGEFGERDAAPQHFEEEQPPPLSLAEQPTDQSMSRPLRPRRETMPPFSQYAPPIDQLPVSDGGQRANKGTGRRREPQDVPQILVSPPTMDATSDRPVAHVEEGQGAGCCKCVVM